VAGLLEGAHAGIGLGHEFLRHTQRCKVLVHVIDGTSPDPIGDYNAIRTELELFNPALIEKPEVRLPCLDCLGNRLHCPLMCQALRRGSRGYANMQSMLAWGRLLSLVITPA